MSKYYVKEARKTERQRKQIVHAKRKRLEKAAPKLKEALVDMVEQFIKYTPQLDHSRCWELINARQALAES